MEANKLGCWFFEMPHTRQHNLLTKQFADKWFCFERFQVIKMFSRTDKCDGTFGGCNTMSGREGWREREEGVCGDRKKGREGRKRVQGSIQYKTLFTLSTESATRSCDLRTECSAPLSMAVKFGHNHGSYVYFILECSRLWLTRLTNSGIHYIDNIVRLLQGGGKERRRKEGRKRGGKGGDGNRGEGRREGRREKGEERREEGRVVEWCTVDTYLNMLGPVVSNTWIIIK